jgi:hypothetical protein
MSIRVWVVGQVRRGDENGWAVDWDLGGVFTTEARAREACTEPHDSMWPIYLDEFLGRETIKPPGLQHPVPFPEE